MHVSDIFSDFGVILSQLQLILDHPFSHPSFVCNGTVDYIEDVVWDHVVSKSSFTGTKQTQKTVAD